MTTIKTDAFLQILGDEGSPAKRRERVRPGMCASPWKPDLPWQQREEVVGGGRDQVEEGRDDSLHSYSPWEGRGRPSISTVSQPL